MRQFAAASLVMSATIIAALPDHHHVQTHGDQHPAMEGHGHKRQVTHSFQPVHQSGHSVHPVHHSVQPVHHGAHHSVHSAHTVQSVNAPEVPAPAPLPTLAELVAIHPKLTTLFAA